MNTSPQRAPRHLALVLGILTAFGPFSIDTYLPAFPQITRDLAARPGRVQLTLAVFLLCAGAGQAFYGSLADRLGRRRPMLLGCALYALGSLGCAFAPTMNWLIAARAVQALGGAAGLVVSRAVVRDLFDERAAARMFSQLMLVMGIAPIVAPWLGGQILTFGSWRLIFLLLAAFGCACFVMTALALPETHPPVRRTREGLLAALRTFGSLLQHRQFLGYSLVAGFTSGTNFAYIAGSSFVYIELYGVSVQHFGLFFGLNALGLMVSTQMNRWLLLRRAPETILAGALATNLTAGLALAVCGATGWGGLPAVMVFLFVSLFSIGLSFPNLAAAAMAPFGRKAGSASAVLGTLQFAVGGIAGAAVGLLHNGTALPMTGTVAVCAMGGFAALHTLVTRRPGGASLLKEPPAIVAPED